MEKSKFNILIAEDDEIVRDVMVRFLTDEGYKVFVAEDGISAMNILRIEDIHLVLTDLRMPGADGMEVLRTAIKINPKISVVILTAYGTLDDALKAMKEGAYDYIVKPFVMQQLLLVVRNAHRMYELMIENERLSKQLRDALRRIEALKSGKRIDEIDIPQDPEERINNLMEMGLLERDEADILIGRIRSASTTKESMKRYSDMIDNLKNN